MAHLNSNFVDIDDLIKAEFETIATMLADFEDVLNDPDSPPSPTLIENDHVSGFVPFTQGGFEIVAPALLSYAYGSGTAPPCIKPYIDAALKDAVVAFREYNDLHPEEQPDDPDHPLYNDYCNFEYEHLSEGGMYFYKLRAIYYTSPEPHVVFTSAVNTDFEYGRDYIQWMPSDHRDPNKNRLTITKTVDQIFDDPKILPVIAKQLVENLYA